MLRIIWSAGWPSSASAEACRHLTSIPLGAAAAIFDLLFNRHTRRAHLSRNINAAACHGRNDGDSFETNRRGGVKSWHSLEEPGVHSAAMVAHASRHSAYARFSLQKIAKFWQRLSIFDNTLCRFTIRAVYAPEYLYHRHLRLALVNAPTYMLSARLLEGEHERHRGRPRAAWQRRRGALPESRGDGARLTIRCAPARAAFGRRHDGAPARPDIGDGDAP